MINTTNSSSLLLLLFLQALSCCLALPTFNILTYGANPDGQTISTAAIVNTIQAASATKAPHAIVLVPRGTYLTGSFALASHITLYLDQGATLLASTNPSEYNPAGWNWDPSLIDTHQATDIHITGKGTINGQAPSTYWSLGFDPIRNYFIPRTWQGLGGGCVGECRPKLLQFTDCTNITLDGIQLLNSPDWNILFRRSSQISLHRLYVYGDSRWPNNDGVDFESCENITITQSTFDVGDDGIVLSSGNTNTQRIPFQPQPPPPTRNVRGKDLTIKSHSSAIKFEAIFAQNHSDIYNVGFENIEIYNSSRGIGFQQRTGTGNIYNISFHNVSIRTSYPTGNNWWGSGEPIWLTNIAENNDDGTLTGSIKDITFSNIRMRSENGILLSGLSSNIGPIHFVDCSLHIVVQSNCTCSKGDSTIVPFHTGCRDYRPLDPTSTQHRRAAVVYDKTSGIVLEGQGEVQFGKNVIVSFDHHGDEPSWWTGKCLTSVHNANFTASGQVNCSVVVNKSPLPNKWKVSGITFTSGRYCPNVTMGSKEGLWSLSHLASTGATHVSVVVTSYQHSINTTDIFPLYNASQVAPEYYVYVTVSDKDLIAAIRHAKKLNLSVLLKPHVDPLTDNAPIGKTWRGNIGMFFNESQWDLWFDSYWQMFQHYVQIAVENQVDMISMNCELISANNQTERWRHMVSKTRSMVSGHNIQLTTSPNGHGHEDWVEWYDVLDIIGVDFYDHVNGTTVEDMVKSWGPYLNHLESLSKKYQNKQVMMTEMGSCSGPHGGCERDRDATPTSRTMQAARYEALFLATRGKEDWFLGGFWWNWDSDPAVGWGEDENDACLNPAWKPAESVLRKYYRAEVPVPMLPREMQKSRCLCTF